MFDVHSGITQGCPLSGWLSGAGADPFLRWLTTMVSPMRCLARACADDVGALLRYAACATSCSHGARFSACQGVCRIGDPAADTCAHWFLSLGAGRMSTTRRGRSSAPRCRSGIFSGSGGSRDTPRILVGPRSWSVRMDQAPLEKWEERARCIAQAAPPVAPVAAQHVEVALLVSDFVAAMSAPPSDLRERERRVAQKNRHLPVNSLPGDAQVDLAKWHCPDLPSAEARMRAVAARVVARTCVRELARTAQAAEGRSGESPLHGRDGAPPRWWDSAACDEVLGAADEVWHGWRGRRAGAAVDASAWAHVEPQAAFACALAWLAGAAHERLRRTGVEGAPRLDALRSAEIRDTLRHLAGFGALACATSWRNAWATSRRTRDSRGLVLAHSGVSAIGARRSRTKFCGVLWQAPREAAEGGPRCIGWRSATPWTKPSALDTW